MQRWGVGNGPNIRHHFFCFRKYSLWTMVLFRRPFWRFPSLSADEILRNTIPHRFLCGGENIFMEKKEEFSPGIAHNHPHFFAGIWLGILGGLANCIVEIQNGSRMPVALQYIKNILLANGAMSSRHVVANADTKVFWLCDYIPTNLYPSINFFFPGSLVSPGDLALICCFILVYVFPLILVGIKILSCAARACYSFRKRYF